MNLDLSPSAIFAGILFSAVGLYFLKRGKRDSEPKLLIIGLAMMGYTFFIENHFLMWAIGLGLWGWGYYEVKGKYGH